VIAECVEEESDSESSVSFYDAYDPFDYLDGSGTAGDPLYAAVVKDRIPTASSPPPPLPPRNSTYERRRLSVERKVGRNCFQQIIFNLLRAKVQYTLFMHV
jgi:hypothetical protein